MNYNLLGSSDHEIFQARILEWDAISFSKVSSQPRDQTQVSALQADALPSEPAGKPPKLGKASTLAWKIPWTEEPGRLQSMGSLRVGHDWTTSLLLFTFMHWRRKWQPTPVFLPGESQGWQSLVGCRLWGHRVGHNWSDLAAAVIFYFYV